MSIEIPGYKILRAIGRGGMATVYLAEQEIFEREVALKVMSKSLAEDPSFGQRFFREAKIVSQLVHPNIVTVHDVGEHEGHYYLSMEYIDGGDLKLARRRLTFRQKIRAIRDIATALQYAANKGYVHRDIKPENIMFHLADGRAVLTDFGIARAAEAELSVTQTGVAIGTPHYMSPEQAKGQAVDGRSDIYSLGVVLYLTLTGKVPFDAESAVAIGIKHITDPIPLLPVALNDLQPLLDKMMAKAPDQRFQNAASLISALDQLDMPVLEKLALDYDREQQIKESQTDAEDETPTLVSSPASPQVTAPVTPPPQSRPAMASTSGGVEPSASNKEPSAASKAKPAQKKKIDRQEPQLGTTTEINEAVPHQDERFTVIFDNDELDTSSRGVSFFGIFVVVLILGSIAGAAYFYLNPAEWEKRVLQVQHLLQPEQRPDQAPPKSVVEEQTLPPEEKETLDTPSDPAPVEVLDTPEPVEDTTRSTIDNLESASSEEETGLAEAEQEQTEEALFAKALEEQKATIFRLQEAFAKDAAFLPDLVAAHRQMLELNPGDVESQQALDNLEQSEKSKIEELIASKKFSAARKKLEQLQSLFGGSDTNSQNSLEAKIEAEENKENILAKAAEYYSAGALVEPEGANALSMYKELLAIDERDARALQGVRKVSDFYFQQASAAFAEENIELAEEKVKQALEVDWKNDSAETLLENIRNLQERKAKQDLLFLQAEQALNTGSYFEPVKENAYHFYAQILEDEPENVRALRGVVMLKEGFSLWLQDLVNQGEYQLAEMALVTPLNILPQDQELQELAENINKQIAERSVKNQAAIDKVLVSGNQISDVNAAQQDPIRAGRNIYVGFQYSNISSDANQMEARLLDGAGNIEVAKAAVVLDGGNGVAILLLESPVGSFPVGLYTLELNLQGRNLFSRVFTVE